MRRVCRFAATITTLGVLAWLASLAAAEETTPPLARAIPTQTDHRVIWLRGPAGAHTTLAAAADDALPAEDGTSSDVWVDDSGATAADDSPPAEAAADAVIETPAPPTAMAAPANTSAAAGSCASAADCSSAAHCTITGPCVSAAACAAPVCQSLDSGWVSVPRRGRVATRRSHCLPCGTGCGSCDFDYGYQPRTLLGCPHQRGRCGGCGTGCGMHCGHGCGHCCGRLRAWLTNGLCADHWYNCQCAGSYKFPVPPQYTFHWPGLYSHRLMTDYHSPWRFPPLRPFTEEPSGETLMPTAAVAPRAPSSPSLRLLDYSLAAARLNAVEAALVRRVSHEVSRRAPASPVQPAAATVTAKPTVGQAPACLPEASPGVDAKGVSASAREVGMPEPTSRKLERLYGNH